MIARLRSLFAHEGGAMAIETALVAPLLAAMALGAFEASSIVSRQQQLQSAANEASEIILAAAGGSGISSTDLEEILETSLGLASDDLAIDARYRCGAAEVLLDTPPDTEACPSPQPVYNYVQLTLSYDYTPIWTNFGIGSPISYDVVRTVQVS